MGQKLYNDFCSIFMSGVYFVFNTSKTLESLIRDKIMLGPVSNTGYHILRCPCCHDYKPRGGFKFEGGKIYYACFNCGLKPVYEEDSGNISKKFRSVLHDFDIKDSEIDEIVNVAFFKNKKPVIDESATITLDSLKKSIITPVDVKLPPQSIRLGSTSENKDYQEKLTNYLKDRCIDPYGYPFFYSLNPKMINRVIIPFYKSKKLIYWQARSIDDESPRYRNCEIPKTSILFNMDQLTSWTNLPIFVTEGVFDALPLNGIATLGGAMNDEKLELLNRTSRRLIFILDRDVIGKKVGELVLARGWDITFPPEGTDVNKSFRTYGKLWTVYELMKNIPKNLFEARLRINLNCSYDSRKDNKKYGFK
jgi:hypothetical protein